MGASRSGASAGLLTVDPTSNARRSTLYSSDGTQIASRPTSYLLPISIRSSATFSTTWFAMRVDPAATKIIYIRRIYLATTQDNGGGGSGNPGWQRFSTATPTGGNTLTVIKKRNTDADSQVIDARISKTDVSVGLTTTGTVLEPSFLFLRTMQNVGQELPKGFDTVWTRGFSSSEYLLQAGEGLLVSGGMATGGGCFGYIEWDER